MPRLKTARPPAPPEREATIRRGHLTRRRKLLIWLIAAALIVLGLAQLLLPPIATRVLRHQLSSHGTVISAQVHAFPAIELLWRHADSVSLRMRDYNLDLGQVTGLLHQGLSVNNLDVSIATLRTGLLTMNNATLTKRGSTLTGTAQITDADLQRALPIIRSVTPVSNADGTLVLRGTGNAFGVSASVDATVEAIDGKLVVAPTGLLGILAKVTVFSDPKIYVENVTGGRIPGGISVTVTAQER